MGTELTRTRADEFVRHPLRELARMERDIEEMFSQFGRGALAGEVGIASPAVDVLDREKEIVVRADLPGVEKNDVEVTVEEGALTLRGERRGEREEKSETCYRSERWSGSFTRRLALPPGVDPDKISATFASGVLEIHVPKTTESKAKKVEIKTS
jgi:HSP20 family protein